MLTLPFLPFKILFFLGRTLGWTRLLFLIIGIGIGLAIAPTAGVELREKLKELATGVTESGASA